MPGIFDAPHVHLPQTVTRSDKHPQTRVANRRTTAAFHPPTRSAELDAAEGLCILAAMRIILGLIKLLVFLVLVTVVGGLGTMYYLDPIVTERLIRVPLLGEQPGVPERVAGGPVIDIPTAATNSLSEPALRQAMIYGESTGTHSLIVYHDGAIELEHYYPGYSASDISPTQSMHKSVLAMLVGIAIDEGHITSVDDSAAKYLTEWADDDRANITIRQMLRQTSGIDFATFGLNPLGGFFQLMLGANVTPAALELPLEVEPGTRFDYNSAIPQNMGLIIQRATGMRYADYLSQALWQYLGAGDAFVILDSEEHRMPRTSCCLEAPARAWLHLGLLHLNRGQLGDRQIVSAQWMDDIAVPGKFNPNYGYFTWLGNKYDLYRTYNRKTETHVLHSEPFVASDVRYFDGFGGQRVYIIPSRKLVIVRIGDISTNWDDAYLANLLVRDVDKSAKARANAAASSEQP